LNRQEVGSAVAVDVAESMGWHPIAVRIAEVPVNPF